MNTKKKINIGIVGYGAMGRTHTYAIRNLPYFYATHETPLPFEAVISGICTTSEKKSLTLTEELSLGRVYKNFDEMVNDETIDVIDICTPNVLHYDMLKKALAKGKHIYCEKPLCDTYKRSAEIAELTKGSGLICKIVFNCRHLAAVKRAKKLIDSGAIGDIISYNFEYLHDTCTFPEKSAGWKQNADICGEGGVLFDLGSHIIDMAVMLCGNFKSVTALSQIAYQTHPDNNGGVWSTNASEAFYMITRSESGAVGTLTASKIAKGTNDGLNFQIYGTKGALKFSLMEPGRLHFFDGTLPKDRQGFTVIECGGQYEPPAGFFPSPKAPSGWLMGHLASMYSFLHDVYSGDVSEPDFNDGAYVSRVMDAALRSAKCSSEVEV